jgi:hypothetical protein
MLNYIPRLTWAWIIIIGGLMIYPKGIECIVCGPTISRVLGVISVVLGMLGFASGRRSSDPMPGRQ